MTLVYAKVTISSALPSNHRISHALYTYAVEQGWQMQDVGGNWRAICYDIDAQDIKEMLRNAGFTDTDFQIYLEYQRAWGFL